MHSPVRRSWASRSGASCAREKLCSISSLRVLRATYWRSSRCRSASSLSPASRPAFCRVPVAAGEQVVVVGRAVVLPLGPVGLLRELGHPQRRVEGDLVQPAQVLDQQAVALDAAEPLAEELRTSPPPARPSARAPERAQGDVAPDLGGRDAAVELRELAARGVLLVLHSSSRRRTEPSTPASMPPVSRNAACAPSPSPTARPAAPELAAPELHRRRRAEVRDDRQDRRHRLRHARRRPELRGLALQVLLLALLRQRARLAQRDEVLAPVLDALPLQAQRIERVLGGVDLQLGEPAPQRQQVLLVDGAQLLQLLCVALLQRGQELSAEVLRRRHVLLGLVQEVAEAVRRAAGPRLRPRTSSIVRPAAVMRTSRRGSSSGANSSSRLRAPEMSMQLRILRRRSSTRSQ